MKPSLYVKDANSNEIFIYQIVPQRKENIDFPFSEVAENSDLLIF